MTDSQSKPTNEQASPEIAAWLDRFLATALRRFPVDATFLGTSEHDHSLPDYSHEADADWIAQAESLIRTLDSIPVVSLPLDDRFDAILARGQLQLWIQEAHAPQFQSGNPAYHIAEALAGVVALLPGNEPPANHQIEAASARLQAIPAYLETARQRTRSAPLAWTELAIRQANAFTTWLDTGMPRILEQWDNVPQELAQSARLAQAAFVEHATWLRSTLADRPIDIPSAGTDAMDAYLHLGHLLPAAQTPQWWFDYAHAELIEATTELRELAKSIDWRVSSHALLQRLADEHPAPETYDTAFPRTWEQCRSVAEQFDLVTWPDAPLRFQPLAAEDAALWRAIGAPAYRRTPPLAPASAAHALYPALDPSLSGEEQARLLRQMNHAHILLEVVVRNAGLGRHVQCARSRNAPTLFGQLASTCGATRRLFFSGNAASDGWACYAAELMEETGALSPLQRLSEARRRMYVAARAMGDIGIQTGELSMPRVARMYRDEVGMPATVAMEHAVRDSMHPGSGMAELAGAAGIDELRRAIEDREGSDFELRAFHDRFLSHGAIPVTLIAASMLDVADT